MQHMPYLFSQFLSLQPVRNFFKKEAAPPTLVGTNTIRGFGDWQYESQATTEDIFHCFRLLLGRPPNREEWPGHSQQAGNAIDAVVASYLNSLEFAQRQVSLQSNRAMTRIEKISANGLVMFVNPEDADLGIPLMRGDYEPHVTKVFRAQFNEQTKCVLDIGANIGYFALQAAALMGGDGLVYAVEPNADNVKLLELSRRENHFENIKIINTAVGESIGILSLNSSWSNGTTATLSNDQQAVLASTVVPCLRLDDVIATEQKVDLIKIDIEGFEYRALLGAKRILTAWHPIIVSEFSPDFMPLTGKNDGRTYLELLFQLGYQVAIIETSGELLPAGQDVEKVLAYYQQVGSDHVDLLFTISGSAAG